MKNLVETMIQILLPLLISIPLASSIAKRGWDARKRENTLKMPVSVADVYNDHVKVKGRTGNLTQVRKLVRSVIFPKMKFVTNEATFSQPAHISEKSVQHDFLVGMNWHENNTDVDKALRWNTYSTDVGKTLSQCRSSSICYMKRNLIPGKCSTLISFRTCYRIY